MMDVDGRMEQIWLSGYDEQYNGNSILLKLKTDYIFIGKVIYSFKSIAPMKTYISFVGNSDFIYPYAIDVKNNYYLMNEDVILLNKKLKDPYDYYYTHQDINTYKGQLLKNSHTYFPDPLGSDYDRLVKQGFSMTIETKTGKKYHLTKQDFINWMKDFGKSMGYQYLDHNILVRRQ